ncbi:hypothetical protein NDU88_000064, partial [Pleurodeles waltl]
EIRVCTFPSRCSSLCVQLVGANHSDLHIRMVGESSQSKDGAKEPTWVSEQEPCI